MYWFFYGATIVISVVIIMLALVFVNEITDMWKESFHRTLCSPVKINCTLTFSLTLTEGK